MNMFVAGRDVIRWEVTALDPEGPYRLVMHHAQGAIVEYFRAMKAALTREAELEALLLVVGAHGQSWPDATPTARASGGN
jgi:hypothetical protein